MKKIFFDHSSFLIFLLLAIFIVASCAKNENTIYYGPVYQQTDKVAIAFLPEQVAENCFVFAHLLITIPAGKNGLEIAEIVTAEAQLRGADTILIGQSRKSEKDAVLTIRYFGPTQEYLCRENWCGWKFGYDVWEKQGNWVDVGYTEWNNNTRLYEHSITLQIAFLRCK
jgi:hypothetical protein